MIFFRKKTVRDKPAPVPPPTRARHAEEAAALRHETADSKRTRRYDRETVENNRLL
jgi:hypothetical protein